jgi:hypothetical protein
MQNFDLYFIDQSFREVSEYFRKVFSVYYPAELIDCRYNEITKGKEEVRKIERSDLR